MSEVLNAFVPLFAFMLLPVGIPIVGATVGWVVDQFGGGRQHDALVARLAELKERSHAPRTAIAARHEAHEAQHAAPSAFATDADGESGARRQPSRRIW